MEQTRKQIIEETIVGLLKKLDFEASIEVTEQNNDSNTFVCMARVEKDQNFLIGQYGANLAAVQHLVRVMLRKKIEERVNIVVDVNDYFLEKKVLLEKEAQKAAEEAVRNSISVAMRPMLPYERKVVHSFLAQNQNITTESIGSGEERKVMVSPKATENESAESI